MPHYDDNRNHNTAFSSTDIYLLKSSTDELDTILNRLSRIPVGFLI
jgi:hypothetical protein